MKIQICSCRTALCEHIFFEITHTQRNKLDENWILYLYGKWRNCVMAEKKALENEEIKEYGQIELNENASSITFSCFPLSEKWKDMNVWRQIQKQRNMSMYCQSWQRQKMTEPWMVCWCF